MIPPDAPAGSLVGALRGHASQSPDKPALAYSSNGEEPFERMTFGELDRRARRMAGALQEVASPGDRALLLYPSGLDFIAAFLGCLYAGVVAVPTTLPHLRRASPRLTLMLEDSQAGIACTTAELQERIREVVEFHPDARALKWIVGDGPQAASENKYRHHQPLPEDLAFLQYTSGSTSDPKGVMISHRNLVRTIQDYEIGADYGPGSVTSTWLPMFHDMGLIVTLLTPLYAGTPVHILPPVAFLEKPFRWLKQISDNRATHTAAPNFAFDLCARKVTDAEKAGLDLSSLTCVLNAAEPIRYETLEGFSRAFQKCGFSEDAFTPGYGLAEATVKVSTKRTGEKFAVCHLDPELLKLNRLSLRAEADPTAYKSIGCGWSAIGAQIRIVDPQTCTGRGDDDIGEIWVKSDSVAQGYFGRPAQTEETFQARLADSGEGPFLRTGDLGFIHDGQLFIAGRIKDMVIIQGRNYYPHDLELSVEQSHPALRPSCGAAFTVTDGQAERLVMVQEVRREYRQSGEFDEIAAQIRLAVAKNHGVRLSAVVLIAPSTALKTTSGKIQRAATRADFLHGRLTVLYDWRAPGLSFEAAPAGN